MIPADVARQAAQEYLRGDPIKDIVARHGVSNQSIRNIADKYGCPRRPRGAPKGTKNRKGTND